MFNPIQNNEKVYLDILYFENLCFMNFSSLIWSINIRIWKRNLRISCQAPSIWTSMNCINYCFSFFVTHFLNQTECGSNAWTFVSSNNSSWSFELDFTRNFSRWTLRNKVISNTEKKSLSNLWCHDMICWVDFLNNF